LIYGKKPLQEVVVVTVSGKPDDFEVELESAASRDSLMLGSSTTAFGGGGFFLRELKSKEDFEKLEREFWVFVEELVTRLENSARHAS